MSTMTNNPAKFTDPKGHEAVVGTREGSGFDTNYRGRQDLLGNKRNKDRT